MGIIFIRRNLGEDAKTLRMEMGVLDTFKTGDRVVYRRTKVGPCPSRRARRVDPAPRGEDYVYEVDRFWLVADVRDDGTLVLRTRRGKQHLIRPADPNLRPASWWERLLYRDRFPRPE
jgi:hypothetical protein